MWIGLKDWLRRGVLALKLARVLRVENKGGEEGV